MQVGIYYTNQYCFYAYYYRYYFTRSLVSRSCWGLYCWLGDTSAFGGCYSYVLGKNYSRKKSYKIIHA